MSASFDKQPYASIKCKKKKIFIFIIIIIFYVDACALGNMLGQTCKRMDKLLIFVYRTHV